MLLDRLLSGTAAVALVIGTGTFGLAQQQDRGDRPQRDNYQQEQDYDQDRRSRSQDRQREDREDQWREDEDRRGSRQPSESRNRISPQGWVRVATDYDNDGTFDAVETIFYYDLQKARESSRERAGREADRSQPSESRMNRDSQRRQESVRGEIQEMHTEQLAGMEEQCVIVRVETDDGETAKAVLGPQSQIRELDLREGDRVTIRGHRGHINDKAMLIAKEVNSGGDRVSVDLPSGRGLKRVRGDIRSTRTARFRNQDEEHLIAEVELVSGKRETVNLGPTSRIRQLDLQQGDEVSLLVRPGRVNGQPAMIAEQIRFNDQTVELPRSANTSRFRGTDRSDFRRDDRSADSRDRRMSDSDAARSNADQESAAEAAIGVALITNNDESSEGIEIQRIMPDSPAERSALREGDRIISINGQSVDTYRDVIQELHNQEPDERVDIGFQRNGRRRTTTLELTSRSDLYDRQGR